MPVTLVVTAGGHGQVWQFPNKETAIQHTLYRPGDAVLCGVDCLLDQFNALQWPALMGLCKLPCAMPKAGYKVRKAYCITTAPAVWQALQRMAHQPPAGARALAAHKAHDQQLRRKNKVDNEYAEQPAPEQDYAVEDQGDAVEAPQPPPEAPTAEAPEGAAKGRRKGRKAKAANAPKAKRGRKPKDPNAPPRPARQRSITGSRGFPLDATIHFGLDAQGNPYNTTTNHPRRPNSKAGKRFSNYYEGMTVAEARAAGLESGDLLWDSRHGFIVIVAPTAAQQPVATAAQAA